MIGKLIAEQMLRVVCQRLLSWATLGYYKPQPSTPVLLQLMRDNIKTIEMNEERVDDAIRAECRRALEYDKSRNRRGALNCIRRKKLYEKRLAKLSDTRWQIEQILFATEDAHVTGAIVNHLRQAGVALREVKSTVNVKEVEKLMDNIKDDMDHTTDVNEALSSPLSGESGVTEDDLTDELEMLRSQGAEQFELQPLQRQLTRDSPMAAAMGTEDWPTVSTLPPLPMPTNTVAIVSPMSTMPLSALPAPPQSLPTPKQAVALTTTGAANEHTF